MLIHDLDDLVLAPDGDETLEELGRRTLAEGPWTTVAYLVRTRADEDASWDGPFLWLHRYQKVAMGWKLVSRFRTTEPTQLARLVAALADWDLTGPAGSARG